MSAYWVVLFPNNTAAMSAERALKKARVSSRLVPVPRHLSCRCGVALRIDEDDVDSAVAALQDARVPFSSVHHVRK